MTEVPPIQPAPATPLDIYIRQMEIGATLAGMHEQLKAVPDHEQAWRETLVPGPAVAVCPASYNGVRRWATKDGFLLVRGLRPCCGGYVTSMGRSVRAARPDFRPEGRHHG
jgi:hypothetical protein